jgi:predicted acyltransferase (DUF342 family)
MRRFLIATVLTAATALPALARDLQHGDAAGSRSSFGSDITIGAEDSVENVACAFCSVHVQGLVRGNVAVLFGDVTVDPEQSIRGNVAVFGGDLSLANEASIGGNVALCAGDLHLDPEALIHGSQSISPSRLWLLVPLMPVLVVVGLIWLIVWWVRRNRYRRL